MRFFDDERSVGSFPRHSVSSGTPHVGAKRIVFVKPGHVFLLRGGASAAPNAKLLDFGLAKASAPTAGRSTGHPITADLTVPGTII